MSAIGSCSAIGNETLSFSAGEAGDVDLDEHDAGRGQPRLRRAPSPRRPAASSPAQNDAGMPRRRPASDAGAARRRAGDDGVEQRDVGRRVRAIGPIVSRVWLIGTTPAPS